MTGRTSMKWNNLVLNDASFIARLIAEWDHQRLSKIDGDRPPESWASCSPIKRMAGSNEGDGVIGSPASDALRLNSVYRLGRLMVIVRDFSGRDMVDSPSDPYHFP